MEHKVKGLETKKCYGVEFEYSPEEHGAHKGLYFLFVSGSALTAEQKYAVAELRHEGNAVGVFPNVRDMEKAAEKAMKDYFKGRVPKG